MQLVEPNAPRHEQPAPHPRLDLAQLDRAIDNGLTRRGGHGRRLRGLARRTSQTRLASQAICTFERDPLSLKFIVPSQSLIEAFTAAQQRPADAVAGLVPLLIEMALTTVAEVLPGATVLETEGEMNEDWLFTLRLQRVLGTDGAVLYDIGVGHHDPEVETRIDKVGFEYLDLLLDLTGDDYLGRKTVSWPVAPVTTDK